MNKYQSVELHATRNGEVCSLKDEFNSFTFFGKVPITEQLEYLAEIYSLETAIEFGHWLINEYNIKIENKILINN